MKRWEVKLKCGKTFQIVSDTPHEDLAAQGYDGYTLTELYDVPAGENIYRDEKIDYSDFLRRKAAGG